MIKAQEQYILMHSSKYGWLILQILFFLAISANVGSVDSTPI